MDAVKACLFVGPTLAARDVDPALGLTCLPPARQGDVHRAVTLLRPRAIGIVDGYFRWVASVWHKEILWAIGRGVHVFGAASMGALRAAELHPFGMHGVGRIFEGYRDGRLRDLDGVSFEDDDEVAVVHGPAELGYPALSEAMVNIRYTLAAACAQAVVDDGLARRLLVLAKDRHFPERSYPTLLADARAAGLDAQALDRLENWLPQGRVDRKRADALALVDAMRQALASDVPPARASFHFECTTLWLGGIAHVLAADWRETPAGRVLEELRLQGAPYTTLREHALAELAPHAQDDPANLAPLDAHHHSPADLDAALAGLVRAHEADRLRAEIPAQVVGRRMLALLEVSAGFDGLRRRAEDKRVRLSQRTDLPDVAAFPGHKLLELRDWYFGEVLGTEMPEDLAAYLQQHDYADEDHLHEALLREFVYREMVGGASSRRERATEGGTPS